MDLDNLFKASSGKVAGSNAHCDLVISKDSGFVESVNQLYAIEGFSKPFHASDIEDQGGWVESKTTIKNVILDLRNSDELVSDVKAASARLDISVKVIVVSDCDSIRIKNQVLDLGANYALWDKELNELHSIVVSASDANSYGVIKTREAKRVLILGTKGGIGVSTLSSALAHSLSVNVNLRTLLVEHDSFAINSDIFLGIKGLKPRQTSLDLSERELDSAIAHTYIHKIENRCDFLAMEKTNDCAGNHARLLNDISGVVAGEYNFIIDSVSVSEFDEISALAASEKYHRIYLVCDTSVSSLRSYNLLRKGLSKESHNTVFIHNKPVKDYMVGLDDARERLKQKEALYVGYESGLEKRLIQQGQVCLEKTKYNSVIENMVTELTGKVAKKKFSFSLFRKS